MAKRKFVITKRRLAIIFAAGVAVGAAGYVVLDRIAQSRAEAALADVQRQLPDDARFAYTGLDASFIGQSATLKTVIFRQGDREIRADTVTVADVGETAGGNVRAGEVTASGIATQMAGDVRIQAGTVRVSDLMVAPGGRTLRSLGKVRVDNLSLDGGEASVRVADLALRGASPRRIGRIDAGVVEIRGLTANASDREVLRGVRVDGLDISAMPPVHKLSALTPAAAARLVRQLAYDALKVRKAAVYRGDQRQVMLRGLQSRRAEADSPKRVWTSGVDEFAIRVDAPQMKMANVVDDDNMLRGSVSGRQEYDPAAGRLALTDLEIEVARAGRLTGAIRFADLPDGADGGAMPDRARLARAKLAEMDITYTDDGILDSALSALATRSGMSRQNLVERRLDALQQIARDAPSGVQESVTALASFVRDGGALRLRVQPEQAVPMSTALMNLTFQPVATAQALNLELSRP